MTFDEHRGERIVHNKGCGSKGSYRRCTYYESTGHNSRTCPQKKHDKLQRGIIEWSVEEHMIQTQNDLMNSNTSVMYNEAGLSQQSGNSYLDMIENKMRDNMLFKDGMGSNWHGLGNGFGPL